MHPAFSTIDFGPFHTTYHRQAVDEDFRQALSDFLERELLPQVDQPFTHTRGRLTAAFDEEKYCGPNSAVRDMYRLEFAFVRERSTDDVEAQICRHSVTGGFRTRFKGEPLTLWTERRKASQQAFREAIGQIVERVRSGEQSAWACPRCSAPLSLIVSPTLFDLGCPEGCFNYHYHRHPETGEFQHGHLFSKPPDTYRAGAQQGIGSDERHHG